MVIPAFYYPHNGQKIGNVIVERRGVFLKTVLVDGVGRRLQLED